MKALLLILAASTVYPQEPEKKTLSEKEENVFMRLQIKFSNLEKAVAPLNQQMEALALRWQEEEAKFRKTHKLADNCRITPERKVNCPETKSADPPKK